MITLLSRIIVGILILLVYSEIDHIFYHITNSNSSGVPLPTNARIVVEWLIKVINITDSTKLTFIDFGCSNGDLIYYISKHHQGPIVGVEIDEYQSEQTTNRFKSNTNISIVASDMIYYTFTPNDILYMYEPLWLIPDKALETYSKVLNNCIAKYIIYVSGVTKLLSVDFFTHYNYELLYETYITRMVFFSNSIYLFRRL
jgi:hypothetical protein